MLHRNICRSIFNKTLRMASPEAQQGVLNKPLLDQDSLSPRLIVTRKLVKERNPLGASK